MTVHMTDVYRKVAQRTGISQSEARRIVENTLDTIQDDVSAGRRVVLRGFGSFDSYTVAAREGLDYLTHDPDDRREFPRHRRVSFRIGSEFRRLLNL